MESYSRCDGLSVVQWSCNISWKVIQGVFALCFYYLVQLQSALFPFTEDARGPKYNVESRLTELVSLEGLAVV